MTSLSLSGLGQLTGAIANGLGNIAQAIERHGDNMVLAAKIEANGMARAAGSVPFYDENGNVSAAYKRHGGL